MTFEEAKEIVLKATEKRGLSVDNATEYEDAFAFGNSKDEEIGGLLPVVIMKETGELYRLSDYLDMTPTDAEPINHYTL